MNTVDELSHAYQVAVGESCLEPESDEEGLEADESLVALVRQAGVRVVDMVCGRGLVGEQTLNRHREAMAKFGLDIEELTSRPHTCRYGNGTADASTRRVQIPVYLEELICR